MPAKVQSSIMHGSRGIIVDIECHLSNNLPTIIIVGSASRSVDEAKERLRGAFANSKLEMPRKRITINLAPADIPKADSGFDLAIAMAILAASGHGSTKTISSILCDVVFIGELGLDGRTRPVRGIIGKLLAGRARGARAFFIPIANMPQARLVPNVTLYAVESLHALAAHYAGIAPIAAEDTGSGIIPPPQSTQRPPVLALDDVIGQDHAKRALEICAAGGHNVLLHGPPGTGKSMLARALSSILPTMNHEEVLEVTHLHSLAGHEYQRIIAKRPVRAPHHSASLAAITGGGASLRPGEISLAHRGVLLLDEFPEFSRTAIESLRQPLEERVISVARAKDTVQYPADFMLVATANPCPCGYAGSSHACDCTTAELQRYKQKLSGPIMDRIDLACHVHKVDHKELLTDTNTSSLLLIERIIRARKVQYARYGNNRLNTTMSNADIRTLAKLCPAAKDVLDQAAAGLQLSARAYMRAIKVARTIADLEGAKAISPAHVSEALAYRPKATI